MIFDGATQGDPVDGSFSLLGRLHLISSFFRILRSGCVGVVEPRLLPRRRIYLFEHRPRLYWFLTLGGGVPIFLAVLAREDPWGSLTLPWERAAGCVVIRTPTVVTESGWPDGVSLLHFGSLAGSGLCASRSLGRSPKWGRGPTSAVSRLDLVNSGLIIFLFLFVGVRVEDVLLRLYILDPLLRGSVTFRREMSGLPASSAPYISSTSGYGPPRFPVFRQVNLDGC